MRWTNKSWKDIDHGKTSKQDGESLPCNEFMKEVRVDGSINGIVSPSLYKHVNITLGKIFYVDNSVGKYMKGTKITY